MNTFTLFLIDRLAGVSFSTCTEQRAMIHAMSIAQLHEEERRYILLALDYAPMVTAGIHELTNMQSTQHSLQIQVDRMSSMLGVLIHLLMPREMLHAIQSEIRARNQCNCS